MLNREPLGATYSHDGTRFVVWSPIAEHIEVHLLRQDTYLTMMRNDAGYFTCTSLDAQPGDRYVYRIDGEKERPDPASRQQPDGVHGPSQIVDPSFDWDDDGWCPPSRRNSVFYELHVGTYTPEGTFGAIIPHLQRLKDFGITTLNIMPVAQFPGSRNWGYDGVQLYAPHYDYGGVDGFKRLVNAAHQTGLAVFLDVVYNHLGPEGNYLWDYGPYFTDRYHSPWGDSVNLDGPHSDPVRRFFIDNAVYWLDEYHIDGLRLDATHALFDFSARPFLEELATTVHNWAANHNRHVDLIAENDRSDRKLTLPREANGYGLDGQWLDDLHHVLHCTLTGESDGYYADYTDFSLMLKVLSEGFTYSGQYSPARQRRYGTSSHDIPADRFIVCTQNHDQVGNRMLGERLTELTDLNGLKIAAALLLTSPYVPLIFMGEEYGETAPFQYFVSHTDPGLVEAVRKGRAEEFAAFAWKGTVPDPQSEATFQRAKLNHDRREQSEIYRLYGDLLALRRQHPALTNPNRADTIIYGDTDARMICLGRYAESESLRIYMNFHLHETQSLPAEGEWRLLYASVASAPDQPGDVIALPPKSFAIYESVTS